MNESVGNDKTLFLSSCPWCGREPQIGSQGKKKRHVTCENLKCPVKPSVAATEIALAIKWWNLRDAPSPLAATAYGVREMLTLAARDSWSADRFQGALESFAAGQEASSEMFNEPVLKPGPFGALYVSSLAPCIQCGELTRWIDLDYDGPMCSAKCSREFGPQPPKGRTKNGKKE